MINDIVFFDRGEIPTVVVTKRWQGYPQTQINESIPIRFNTGTGKLEGYQNGKWDALGLNIEITIDPLLANTVRWVEEKKHQEINDETILNKYPEIKKMKEQYEFMFNLVRKHENESNS